MNERPYKHLRMYPEQHCPEWMRGDKVFLIAKTYTEGELGEKYTQCPLCWPKPTAEVPKP